MADDVNDAIPTTDGPALSIVVPVYNGADTVASLVAAIEGLDVPGGVEVILVVDGSPDNSLAVCRALLPTVKIPLTLVDLARNFGEHNAVMAGLHQARGRHVITMDDDLQNPPSEVLKLLGHAQATGADVVYTWYQSKEHAAWRNWGSHFTNRVADVLLDKPKGLYLSSFRCMSRFLVSQILAYDGPFAYIDGLILQVTQRIEKVEVLHLPRAMGRSNYTIRKLVRLWMNMFVNFSVMPLRISTLTGMGLSVLGGVAAIFVTIEAVVMQATPRGWGSIMAAVLLLSGVQLMILGIVGEYLGRMFLNANRKPQFIVREAWRSDAAAKPARKLAKRA